MSGYDDCDTKREGLTDVVNSINETYKQLFNKTGYVITTKDVGLIKSFITLLIDNFKKEEDVILTDDDESLLKEIMEHDPKLE